MRGVFYFMNITKTLKLDETETFEMDYEGHQITFEAKRASLTPRFIEKLQEAKDVPQALADVLTSWDITSDDEGTQWPLDAASLSRLPVSFLYGVANRIAESWAVDRKKPQD